MRNYLPQQEEPVRLETNRFIEGVRSIVVGGCPIKPKLDKFIPQIFNFRLLALKWIGRQAGINFSELLEDTYPSLEALRSNPKLALLAENMLFALRCNSRVMRAIIGDNRVFSSEELSAQLANAPATTYQQFFATLALSIPDQDAFQLIADFTHSSLYIEFILLAALIIDEENLNVSEDTINELSLLVADAAQDYYAVATQMGLLPVRQRIAPPHFTGMPIYAAEDQLLSNLGLSDFAKNF